MTIKKSAYPARLAIVANVEHQRPEIYAREIYGARRRGHLLPVCSHGAPGVRLFYADGDPVLPPGAEITTRDEIAFHPELTARMTRARQSNTDESAFIRAACELVYNFISEEADRIATQSVGGALAPREA